MGRHAKLCICVRCHDYPDFVLDEVDSIFHYSTTAPHVILAIDRGSRGDPAKQNQIAEYVKMHYPQVGVYKSGYQWGWGAGMYGLLCDALEWADQHYSFDHFLSLDYDALFIGDGADAQTIEDAQKPGIGLVGTVTPIGKTWKQMFDRRWAQIMGMTGGRQPEAGWERHCVYGAVMCLTRPCIEGMRQLGYLLGQFRDTRKSLAISDDPWLTFLVKTAGYEIKNNKGYCYNVWKHPEDYRLTTHRRPELKIWHPAKMAPGGRKTDERMELLCRNYFRRKRGKKGIGK